MSTRDKDTLNKEMKSNFCITGKVIHLREGWDVRDSNT